MLRDWIVRNLHAARMAKLLRHTDDELKELWDKAEAEADEKNYSIDDIWLALNERGLGDYCDI